MIVLLTDFGESEYVGVMKGVILSIAPEAHIVDLTHSITPQSVREAAWVLLKSYSHFPKQSIFLCVVDPGVGTKRDAVLVETDDYVFIGPDNGLFSPVTREESMKQIYSIRLGSTISKTFHGRDVFAVAAARYDLGISPNDFADPKDSLSVSLTFNIKNRTGEVVRIDHFGNVVTNLPPMNKRTVTISTDNINLKTIMCKTYSEGPDSGVFAIVSSAGTIELSAKNQRASDTLTLSIGESITIE